MTKPILRTPSNKAVTPYCVPAHVPIQSNVLRDRPVWVPPKWEPARPGADDHQKIESRGFA
jgi:hypothetical protein